MSFNSELSSETVTGFKRDPHVTRDRHDNGSYLQEDMAADLDAQVIERPWLKSVSAARQLGQPRYSRGLTDWV